MAIEQWVDVVQNSLRDLWYQLLGFLPNLIGALLIFIIGLIVAAILERVIERVIYYLKVDAALKRMGVGTYFQRANMELNIGYFIGKVVYWFIIIAFLLAASDILNFFALSAFLTDVLLYIPRVLVAVLILLAALVAANFLRRLVTASVASAQMHHAKGLGTLTWWVVFIFGFLAALVQLGIATAIIQTLITGFIAMLAIAGGLAFGLGGREQAGKFLHRVSEEMKHGK